MDAIRQMFRTSAPRWQPGLLPKPAQERDLSNTVSLQSEIARLKALNEAQSRLFAAAIHDLRQPLQALLLFTEALSTERHCADQQQTVDRVHQSVNSLERLSTGLLDLVQIEAGMLEPRWQQFALAPVLRELNQTFEPVARKRGLRLVVRSSDVKVRSDLLMLKRVLNNLVSNALHNTFKGGVLVGVRRESGGLRIDVCDTGEGMCTETLERQDGSTPTAVSPASQAPKSQTPQNLSLQSGPVGLGLATVNHLAGLLGARVGLRSSLGRGTTVSIHLVA